ncbi:MAG: outer membrane lipoprotein-sorting protein [bacterium]|nr:outer membrane lipoprotein-sorting protein [bacterium]
MKKKLIFIGIIFLSVTSLRNDVISSVKENVSTSTATYGPPSPISIQTPEDGEKVKEKLTGRDIIKKAEELIRGERSRAIIKMIIVNPSWERTLLLKTWSKGLTRTLVLIISPPKEAGVRSLRIGYDMWNYIPEIEQIIRISPSMMGQPWMGSDFTYSDIVKGDDILRHYNHEIIKIEKEGGYLSYKVECIPKPNAPVVWGKIYYWVRKNDFIPLKEEFYNEQGELIKVLTLSNIRKMDDRLIPTYWKMETVVKRGHYTIIEYISVKFDLKLGDEFFSLKSLKNIYEKMN